MMYTVIMVDDTDKNLNGVVTEIWENDHRFTRKDFKQIIWSLFYDLSARGAVCTEMTAYVFPNTPYYKVANSIFSQYEFMVKGEQKYSYWAGALNVEIKIKRRADNKSMLYRVMNIAKF